MSNQRDEQPQEPDDASTGNPARTETRGTRRLRESGALVVIITGLVQLMASFSKATGGDEDAGLMDSPQGTIGAAMAIAAIGCAVQAWRNRAAFWLLPGFALIVAHVTLFQVLAD